jgi:hypothetical protein
MARIIKLKSLFRHLWISFIAGPMPNRAKIGTESSHAAGWTLKDAPLGLSSGCAIRKRLSACCGGVRLIKLLLGSCTDLVELRMQAPDF